MNCLKKSTLSLALTSLAASALVSLSCAHEAAHKAAPQVEAKAAPVAPAAPVPVPDQEPWRKTPPTPGTPGTITPPSFERSTLKNGLTVIVSQRKGLPLVAVHLVVRSGSGAESLKQAGLANLSYEMLLQGAGKRDTLALADAFADLGTSVSPRVSADGGVLGVSVLRRNVGPVLGLLADMVMRPKLPAKEFDRQQKKQLANLARMAGNPHYLSAQATAIAIYGAKHPYGHQAGGTQDSVKGLSLKDIRRYLKSKVGPKASALVFAGDLSMKEAKALAKKALGRWKGRAKGWKAPAAAAPYARTGITLVPKAGLGQTVLSVGRPAIAAGDPDEWALRIASMVYGGLFSSRLNMNLREDKGYTYGAYARVDTRLGGGSVVAASSVRANVTGPSLKEVFAELAALKTRPITEQEFKNAVEGLVRSVPGWFETVESLAGSADALVLEHQPLDRFDKMLAAYKTLTLEQVRAVAAKIFIPEQMQIVLVGDPTTIRTQVPELGLGSLPPPSASELAPTKKEAAKAAAPSAAPATKAADTKAAETKAADSASKPKAASKKASANQ